MKTIITEGLVKIKIESPKIVSKNMDVFYNPVMGINRDISVLLLNSINKKNLQIADPLAASGIRSIRFLKELNKHKISKIYINDINKNSIKSIKENLKLNNIEYKKNKKLEICNEDANLFLLNSAGFDYIDIDPFGSPNAFLDAACKRLARGGILAVTATDTSALCGAFPKACIRKYWALPKNDSTAHETGLRILIRKVQLIAAQYEKALTPVFSYSREHYMRAFLINDKGKNKADEILGLHGMLNDAGPMWLGRLFDSGLCYRIYHNSIKDKKFNKNKELIEFLRIIKDESKINGVGFYDIHDICSRHKIKTMPKKSDLIEKIKKSGHTASETHFKGEGIRSDIPQPKLINLLKENFEKSSVVKIL